MFNEIGFKIKSLAKAFAIISTGFYGILFLISLGSENILNTIICLTLLVVSVISCWPLYGFGQLVEDSSKNSETLEEIRKSTQRLNPATIATALEKKINVESPAIENIPKMIKTIGVKNFYKEFPLKAISCNILCDDNLKVYLQITFFSYLKTPSVAVKADIVLNTVFKEKITVHGVHIVSDDIRGSAFTTKLLPTEISANEMDGVQDCYIELLKYVNGDEVIDVNEKYMRNDIAESNLQEKRSVFGADYVQEYRNTSDWWGCVCGTTNKTEVTHCALCGRENSQEGMRKVADFSGLWNKINAAANAKEILSIVTQANKSNYKGQLDNIIPKLQAKAKSESMYGNSKKSALSVFKEFVDADNLD